MVAVLLDIEATSSPSRGLKATVQYQPPAQRICGDVPHGTRGTTPESAVWTADGTTAHDTDERTRDTHGSVTDVHELREYGDGHHFEVGMDTHGDRFKSQYQRLARESQSG